LACQPTFVVDVEVPHADEWIDCGRIFDAGAEGDWDHLLYGGFAGSAVTRDGRTLLYYQGASGHRPDGDQTVVHRSIGLAISDDGIHFEKYAGNPVLTWLPNNGPEEGASAGASSLDHEGRVVLFYGANTEAGSPLMVNADVRVAVSEDGLRFEDRGPVLDHESSEVWASGDEVFPLVALAREQGWIVYYVPNGHPEKGVLGVAWGDALEPWSDTARVRGPRGSRVRAWGMGSAGRVGAGVWALFLNRVHEGVLEVRLVDERDFRRVGPVERSYSFESSSQGTVLLDRDRGRWFLYERRRGHYGVRVAPVVASGTAGERPRPCCPGAQC
jgi:hypothetical protein